MQFVCPSVVWYAWFDHHELLFTSKKTPTSKKFFIVQRGMQPIGEAMCGPRQAPMQCSMLSEKRPKPHSVFVAAIVHFFDF